MYLFGTLACFVAVGTAQLFMETDDWAQENAVPLAFPHEMLGLKVTVDTYPSMDLSRDKMANHPVFAPSAQHFVGASAMEDVAKYLHENGGNPATKSAAKMLACRDDPDCRWIWTTSSLLMGAEVEVTGVIGYFNASDAGANRCHVKSQEDEAWCHIPDPQLKATRGRAYLLQGVPVVYPNQSALPIAAMCHGMSGSSKVSLWCHLLSGKEFMVTPPTGFVEVGLVHSNNGFLESPKREVVLTNMDKATFVKKLESEVGYNHAWWN